MYVLCVHAAYRAYRHEPTICEVHALAMASAQPARRLGIHRLYVFFPAQSDDLAPANLGLGECPSAYI